MTRTHAGKEFWLSALRAQGPATRAAFEDAARSPAGLSAPVPSCPGWSVLDLLRHLATTYLWVRSHVDRGVTSRPEVDPRQELGDLPTGGTAIEWWSDQHRRLVTLLDATDPDLPAWNWAPAPKRAGFWHRRMAHETAVHRWDAQLAVGQVDPIDPPVAVDGVAEILDTWLPAGRRRGPLGRYGVVRLAATDADHEWLVRLRGEAVALLDTATWLDHDDHQARVLARGSASDLVLALFGRVPFDLLEVTGDPALLGPLRTG